MSKVFHTIRHLNRTFTENEWAEYCKKSREDSINNIVTAIGEYYWNDCDICLNPKQQTITAKRGGFYGYNVTLKWADCGNGLWSFGIDYNTGTGGGGYEVAFADITGNEKSRHNGYPSELECKLAMADAAIKLLEKSGHYDPADTTRRNNTNRLIKMVEEWRDSLQPKKPKYVQLELFPDFSF